MVKYLINYRDNDIMIFKILKIVDCYVYGTAVTLDLNFNNVSVDNYLALGIDYVRNNYKPFQEHKYDIILPLAEVAVKMNDINNRLIFSKIKDIL